jgi:uncharacterized membrane protein
MKVLAEQTIRDTLRDMAIIVSGMTISALLKDISIVVQIFVSLATFIFIVIRIVRTIKEMRHEKTTSKPQAPDADA